MMIVYGKQSSCMCVFKYNCTQIKTLSKELTNRTCFLDPVSENPSLDETDNNRAASPDVNIVGNENGGLLIQRDDEETTRTKPQSIKRRRPPPTRKLQRCGML